MTDTIEATTMRVWIGCLACYNAGRLVGQWVDADEAAEFVPCTRTEYGTQHEEFWVMDHEGFGGLLSGECSPAEAQRIAEWVADLPTYVNLDAVAAWAPEHYGTDWVNEFDMDDFDEAFAGEWDSFREFADEQAEEFFDLESGAGRYFDYDEWARELAMDYSTHPAPGMGVFIFRQV